jgi:hypothetical protein
MSLIDDIKRDRENGTPGPWVAKWPVSPDHPFIESVCNFAEKPSGDEYYMNVNGLCEAQDARRIARVPEMEAALLAADELADAVSDFLKGPYHELAQPLATYRKATEAQT